MMNVFLFENELETMSKIHKNEYVFIRENDYFFFRMNDCYFGEKNVKLSENTIKNDDENNVFSKQKSDFIRIVIDFIVGIAVAVDISKSVFVDGTSKFFVRIHKYH